MRNILVDSNHFIYSDRPMLRLSKDFSGDFRGSDHHRSIFDILGSTEILKDVAQMRSFIITRYAFYVHRNIVVFPLTIFAAGRQTKLSLHTAELKETVNKLKNYIAQQCFYGRFMSSATMQLMYNSNVFHYRFVLYNSRS